MKGLVAKIGGSLWRSPKLALWIEALRAFPHPLTLVPGGGPFADAVRAAQAAIAFDDVAAHEMALLAMEQYGLALADAFEGLALAATPQAAAALHARGKIAVWRPSAMTLAANIPASWEVTSDSLSAFYARESGAARLLLIKSVDVGEGRTPSPRLRKFASDSSGSASPLPLAGEGGPAKRGRVRAAGGGRKLSEHSRDLKGPHPTLADARATFSHVVGEGRRAQHCAGSLVDPRFASFAQGLDVYIAGPGALARATETFARGEVVGTRVGR